MAYLYDTLTGNAARKAAFASHQLGLTLGEAERVEKVEVHVSGFTDPGEDWCEYVAFDATGAELARRRRAGY